MMRTAAWCVMLVLALCPAAWATEFRTGDLVAVEADEVIEDDLFAAGSSVRIAGRVVGDVLAVGQTVQVTGKVGGSVMAAGQQVEVGGDVDGSVRAAGQNVTLSGSVARNAAAAGRSVVVEDGARIEQDLHVGAAVVDLRGSVGRRVDLGAGTATVDGEVGDRLHFEGDKLTLGPSARVGGDLEHRSAEELEVVPGAQVAGETREIAPKEPTAPGPLSRFGPRVLLFLAVFVFGVVGLAAAPRVFVAASDAMSTRPWWNLLVGLLAVAAAPIAAVVVCITVVGIPLGVLALVLWGAALMFSGVPVGMWLGRWLIALLGSGGASPYLGLLVGLVLLTLVGLVPYLGAITKSLTVLFGMGVYARAAKGLFSELRQQPG